MAFVPAPNIAMLEWRCLNSLQKIENRIMVNFMSAVTEAKLTQLVDIGLSWFEDVAVTELSSAVSLTEVVATDMSALNGPQVTGAPATPVIGLDNSGALPNEVSFCVSLRSGSRGRSARGRLYWLAVTLDQRSDANNIKVAAANDIVAACNTLRQTIENAAWAWSIVSYVSNNAPRVGGPVYFPVEACTYTDLLFDSMKRRKPGVGT